MVPGDLRHLARWLRAEHVQRWWPTPQTPDTATIAAKYLPRLQGREPTQMWVAEVNGRSIGFVQDYLVADYPYTGLPVIDPHAVGVDYAIGEASWVGRGWGSRLLRAWLRTVPDRYPQTSTVVASPDHRNSASLQALVKVGFTPGLWFDELLPDGRRDTMVCCTLDLPGRAGHGA